MIMISMSDASAVLGLCFVACAVWLFIPARAMARYVARLHPGLETHLDSLTLLSAATIGYGAFWVYLFGLSYGIAISIVAFAASCAYVHGRWRFRKDLLSSVPLMWLVAVGLLYCGLLCLNGPREAGPELPRALFSFEPRSIDNLIPFWFAKAVVDPSLPRVGFTFGDWMYSDRPPLQTGMLLFVWPLTYLFPVDVAYEAVSIVAQLFWVAAAIIVLKAFGADKRRVAYVLLLLVSSGFLYFNSVYTWPKLFAGAFCLIAVSSLSTVWLERQKLTIERMLIFSWATAFAALAHTGAVAGCIALALVALPTRRHCLALSFRRLLAAGGAFSSLYLPWAAYVQFVDPPGTRLLVWHLTGRHELGTSSLPKAVCMAYKQVSAKKWAATRISHFRSMFADPVLDADIAACYKAMFEARPDAKLSLTPEQQRYYLRLSEIPASVSSLATLLRYDQVEQVFRSLGLLNAAWLFGPLFRWRKHQSRAPSLVGLLLPAASVSLLLFNLTLFEDGSFLNRNLCHGTLLYLFIGAAWILYDTGAILKHVLLGAHIALNFGLWVYFVPNPMAAAQLGLQGRSFWALGEALIGAGAIALLSLGVPSQLWRGSREVDVAAAHKLNEPWLWGRSQVRILVSILAPMYVAAGAVLIRDGGGGVTVQTDNIAFADRLFDGIRDGPENYAMIPFGSPGVIRFSRPVLLEEIRLRLFDRDGRYYRFTVEYESFGRWVTALDSSQENRSGVVAIPLPAKPITGIRINGLYNSRQELESFNKMLHIHELELVQSVNILPVRTVTSR